MIAVESLCKSFAGAMGAVLRNVTFAVEAGKVFTLLGPSGCGKTTSLRCVAGLDSPDEGRIILGGRTVFSARERIDLSPAGRSIGMVFQSYAIWPHMSVAENVAYPLEGRGLGAAERRRRVARALDLVGLGELADRPAPNLSGGQQQRVALARAIVGEPKVLLLDEPLSNLDAKLRELMRSELTALQRQLGHTVLYVTHDQEEALALSDRLALMRGGEIVEMGDPISMYRHPRHPFTAGFLGAANFIPCRVAGTPREGERVEVETGFGRFSAVARRAEGAQATLFFRPHHARAIPAASARDQGTGSVVAANFLGESIEILLRRGEDRLKLRSHATVPPAPGAEFAFAVDPDYAIAFLPELAAGS